MSEPRAFPLSDTVRLGASLRHAAVGAASMREAAAAVLRRLDGGLLDAESGERAGAVARLFVTRRLGSLPDDLATRARARLPESHADESLRCLLLLATSPAGATGPEPDASDVPEVVPLARGRAPQDAPVPDDGPLAPYETPLLAALLDGLGVDGRPAGASAVQGGRDDGVDVLPVDEAEPAYRVAHVPELPDDAAGPDGVRGLLGFGGVLPDGEVFVVLLSCRVPVGRETAERFATVALSAGVGLLPHVGSPLRRGDPTPAPSAPPSDAPPGGEWRAETLSRLLDAYEETVRERTRRLEDSLGSLEDRASELDASRSLARETVALKSAILSSAVDAIVSIDVDGRVVEWNAAAAGTFGWSRGDVLGHVMVDFLVPPALREQHRIGFARYLASGEGPIVDRRFHTEAQCRDGSAIPVELTVTRVDTPGPPMFTAFLRDMRHAHEAEEEREALLASERQARASAEAAADRLSRLQAVASELSESTTAAQVAEVVVSVGLRQADGTTGALWGVDPDGPSLHVLHAVGPSIGLTTRSPLPLDTDLPVAEAVRASAPVWVTSRHEGRVRYPQMEGVTSDAEAFAVLPLEAEDRTLGALVLGFDEPRTFPKEERRFFEALAMQAAQALERARLRDLEREGARRLAFLAEASRILGSSLDYAATLQNVTELTLSMLGEACVVDLVEPAGDDHTSRVAVAHVDEEVARTLRLSGAGRPPPVVARVLDAGRTEVVDEGGGAELLGAAAGQGSPPDLGPVLVVPLVAHGRTIGTLSVAGQTDAPPYDSGDVSLTEELAQRAAVAIDNARAHRSRTEAAVTLQRSLLLDEPPRTPGLRLAMRYLPGTVGTEVGGDWFDVIPLSVGRCAIVVGDVMGRGLGAAAVMGQLRAAVRAYASLDLRPDVLLSHLDQLVSSLSGSQIVTCTYVVYDSLAGQAVLSTAGHLPPALVVDGEVTLVDLPPGAPLGVGGVPFSTTELSLPPGAVFGLFTDGLVESRERDLDEGLAALRGVLGEAAAGSGSDLEALTDRVLTGLVDVEGHDDDVALLTARTTVEEAEPLARLTLLPDPAVVHDARAFTEASLQSWRLDDRSETVQLLVSELVTNALRHAGTEIELRLGLTDRTLSLEVRDGSSLVPTPRRPAARTDEGGRGLLLVESLSDRWGVRRHADGKTVWCEVAVPRR